MMMPPSAHAKVSPSRLNRIIECPASFNFAPQFESVEDTSSSYANEGTMLHLVMERHLRGKDWRQVDITEHSMDPPLNKEQVGACQDAIEYLRGVYNKLHRPALFVEREVSLHAYHPSLFDCWGTCDIVLQDTETSEVHVIDWKFGKGVPVYAENNDQLYAYATGAGQNQDHLLSLSKVHIHVVQPRLDTYDCVSLDPQDLLWWLNGRVVPAVQEAYSTEPTFHPGRVQCRWCPAKVRCRHRYEYNQHTASEIFQAALHIQKEAALRDEELTDILLKAAEYEQYIKDIRQHIFAELMQGKPNPYWKLVSGRASRVWADQYQAEQRLLLHLDTEDVYETKLISPPKAEKLMRKKIFNELMADLVDKRDSAPVLAHISDKRPPVQMRSAGDVFAGLNLQDELE